MNNLSVAFKLERMKVNNEIHSERCIAHCHYTINTLEEDVREFVNSSRQLLDDTMSGGCDRELVLKQFDEMAGDAFCVEDDQ